MTRFIVFTDLDGTLLDHHSYDYTPALPALNLLKKSGTPLVMVSSKTRQEMEVLRAELEIQDPFIPENGGAVLFPSGDTGPLPEGIIDFFGYQAIILGRPTAEIAPLFDRLAKRCPVRSLSRMTIEEVMAITGLNESQAQGAINREFGEVFVLTDPSVSESFLETEVRELGLRLTRGGRFYHLLGENDKGKAVSLVSHVYRKKFPEVITVGLGDAPNDQPMLSVVDRPFLVAAPDGGHRSVKAPGLVKISRPGPAGFQEAISTLFT